MDVLYAIDKRASYLKADIPLYAPDSESFPKADILIISILGHYREVETALKGKIDCRMIELDELINDAMR